jgi:quercetin dioxygenase-like cupin family protein
MTIPLSKCTFGVMALSILAIMPPSAFGEAKPAVKSGGNIVMGDSVSWTPMAGYKSKTFTLPTGSIRIVEFKKSGAAYKLTSETEMYVLKGSAEVTVGGVETALMAGDVVNLPSGVLHPLPGQPEDTTVVLYTVPNSSKTPAPGVVRAKDAKEITVPPTPEKDGVVGAGLTVRSYVFDGNSIRVATLRKPGRTPLNAHGTDSIMYLLSGKMKLTIGDEVTLVHAGDALREPAGVPTSWEVLEDSSFVSTSAPHPPDAAQ